MRNIADQISPNPISRVRRSNVERLFNTANASAIADRLVENSEIFLLGQNGISRIGSGEYADFAGTYAGAGGSVLMLLGFAVRPKALIGPPTQQPA